MLAFIAENLGSLAVLAAVLTVLTLALFHNDSGGGRNLVDLTRQQLGHIYKMHTKVTQHTRTCFLLDKSPFKTATLHKSAVFKVSNINTDDIPQKPLVHYPFCISHRGTETV